MQLSERQKQVLQCVIDAKNDGKRPYTKGVVKRMMAKGFQITERQCAYDLGVIINTKGTGVFSMKTYGKPTAWVYDENILTTGKPTWLFGENVAKGGMA